MKRYEEPAQEEMALFQAAETTYTAANDAMTGNHYPPWKDLTTTEKDYWVSLAQATITAYETAYGSSS